MARPDPPTLVGGIAVLVLGGVLLADSLGALEVSHDEWGHGFGPPRRWRGPERIGNLACEKA